MILITGATGNIGVGLVKILSGAGQSARAFVRNPARRQAITILGIELVEGDFAKPETSMPALDGVDLLIPSSSEVEQQQRNFVDAAKRSKVRHLVKVSQLAADEHAAGRFQRHHAAVEKQILKSGILYTFLRPNLFIEGLLNVRSTISSEGAFYAPAGDAKVSIVDARDIASLAARALTEWGHAGKTDDITGPEALTHAEMAQQLSKAVGKANYGRRHPSRSNARGAVAFWDARVASRWPG